MMKCKLFFYFLKKISYFKFTNNQLDLNFKSIKTQLPQNFLHRQYRNFFLCYLKFKHKIFDQNILKFYSIIE
jgi:hypothetical protein